MKKLISGISALTLAAAMSMSASAASAATIIPDPDNMPNPKPASAGFEVKYDVDPSYTVTIPAGVDITTGDKTEDITLAQGALLPEGAKIKVVLESGQYTTSGSSFTAKTASGNSSASYQINDGAVKVGDVVASLDKDTLTSTLTFSRTTTITPTYAGAHTETLTFTITVEDAVPANPYASNNVGDVVTFGSYDWYIIGKSDNGVTLLMKENLTTKAYYDYGTNTTWESCILRTYLNGEFYNSFSADDKAKIALTHNTNLDNPEYGTDGGNDTNDYIYLLSIAEANALSDNIRANGSLWWLRSPGAYSRNAAAVNENGSVGTFGYSSSSERGVRPALNLKF